MTTELYLVRHGETVLNEKGVYYGWSDCELSEKGKYQCEELKEILSEVPFDLVVSSPLKRAVDSVRLITGREAESIQMDNRLKEMNFGLWEGLSQLEIENRFKSEWDLWSKDWKYISTPQGESFKEMYDRVEISLKHILENHAGKKILMVTHNGTMRIMTTLLLGLEMDHYWHFNFEHGRYSLFDVTEGFCVIRRINSRR